MPTYDLSSVSSCVQLMLDQKDKANREVIFHSLIKKHDPEVAAKVLAELHKIHAGRPTTARGQLEAAKELLR